MHISELTGPDAVHIAEVEPPRDDPDQVLIEVHAAGVTFPELLQTRGLYQIKPDPPFVPGSEVAGLVLRAPPDCGVKAGDRVAAFPGIGGFAEQVQVDPRMAFPLPDRFSYPAGAALPMNLLTMHLALKRRGRLKKGETVLVHGAAGGIGTVAVQMSRALGARVIAVVSTDAKAEVARRAGAHEVVKVEGFRQRVLELTDGEGVNVVVDPVGGDRFTDSLRSLAPEGRLLVIGFTSGEIPMVKVNRLLLRNLDLVGVGMGNLWRGHPEFMQEQWTDLLPLMESGSLDPILGTSYPLERAADALRDIEQRRAVGKVVLLVR